MARRRQEHSSFIRGGASHRRTETDYMNTLLDAVTLADWQEVVVAALEAAKKGDATARGWLSQYLVGKPGHPSPTPLSVIVQQLSGHDPVVNRIAEPMISRALFPFANQDAETEDRIRAMVAIELSKKMESTL